MSGICSAPTNVRHLFRTNYCPAYVPHQTYNVASLIGPPHFSRHIEWTRGTSRGDWPTTRADQILQHLIGQPENPRIPKLVVVVVVVVVGGAEMPVNVVQSRGYKGLRPITASRQAHFR